MDTMSSRRPRRLLGELPPPHARRKALRWRLGGLLVVLHHQKKFESRRSMREKRATKATRKLTEPLLLRHRHPMTRSHMAPLLRLPQSQGMGYTRRCPIRKALRAAKRRLLMSSRLPRKQPQTGRTLSSASFTTVKRMTLVVAASVWRLWCDAPSARIRQRPSLPNKLSRT